MNERPNREVIEQIVIEVINRLKPSESIQSSHKPGLLVVNMDHSANDSRIQQLTNHWQVVNFSNPYGLPPKMTDAVFLNITQDLLVKGALGIADTPESRILAQLIVQGSRVRLIPAKSFEWIISSSRNDDSNLYQNKIYMNHFYQYKTKLEMFGVKIQHFNEFSPIKAEEDNQIDDVLFNKKLLTQKDVETFAGEVISVRHSTVITPLARDTIKKLGKRLCIV
ncbi:hypothetical protein [Scopulibacillus cellulosilyticus]|uniref:Ethanolamine utilization protein n=1 Tax=Scopulibacillus cellulosilyticus TaxID=2665665 RepID=A0ABW2PSM2_9BACL